MKMASQLWIYLPGWKLPITTWPLFLIPHVQRDQRGRHREDPTAQDWLHINQSYVNETNSLLIASGRHQSAVFGISLETESLQFIMSTHEDWSEEYKPYLLTPVDSDGVLFMTSAIRMMWMQQTVIFGRGDNTM